MTSTTSGELVRQPRSRDKKLAGVCAALGERWEIDPLLLRTAMVLAALSGGVGVVVYAILWLWMPSPDGHSPIAQILPAWREWSTPRVIALATVLSVVVFAALAAVTPFGAGPLIVLGVVVVLGRRQVQLGQREDQLEGGNQHDQSSLSGAPTDLTAGGHGSAAACAPALGPQARPMSAPRAQPAVTAQQTWAAPRVAPTSEFGEAVHAWQQRMNEVTHAEAALPAHAAPHPTGNQISRPTQPQAPVAPVTATSQRLRTRVNPSWWGSLITAGVATLAYLLTDVATAGPLWPLVAALGVIAVGLLVGAWVGRPRLMIATGLVMALCMVPAAVMPTHRVGPTTGSVSWATAEELSDVTLNGQSRLVRVGQLKLTEDRTVTINATSSTVVVEVPPGQPVTIEYTTSPGAMAFGRSVRADRNQPHPGSEGASMGHTRDTVRLGPETGARLTIVMNLRWSAGTVATP